MIIKVGKYGSPEKEGFLELGIVNEKLQVMVNEEEKNGRNNIFRYQRKTKESFSGLRGPPVRGQR